MVKIRLLGELGEKFGREFDLEISTPREAIKAIGYQIDGFFDYLISSAEHGVGYRVIVPASIEGLLENQLEDRFSGGYLTISPEIAQGGAVGRILLGVILIGVSFFLPGAILGISSLTIGLAGAALVLGGIATLLTPREEPKSSGQTTFGAFQSDGTSQGKCMPLRYGEGWCQLLRISGRITVNATETTTPSISTPPTDTSPISFNPDLFVRSVTLRVTSETYDIRFANRWVPANWFRSSTDYLEYWDGSSLWRLDLVLPTFAPESQINITSLDRIGYSINLLRLREYSASRSLITDATYSTDPPLVQFYEGQ